MAPEISFGSWSPFSSPVSFGNPKRGPKHASRGGAGETRRCLHEPLGGRRDERRLTRRGHLERQRRPVPEPGREEVAVGRQGRLGRRRRRKGRWVPGGRGIRESRKPRVVGIAKQEVRHQAPQEVHVVEGPSLPRFPQPLPRRRPARQRSWDVVQVELTTHHEEEVHARVERLEPVDVGCPDAPRRRSVRHRERARKVPREVADPSLDPHSPGPNSRTAQIDGDTLNALQINQMTRSGEPWSKTVRKFT